jgi:hypothetical protein
MRCTESYQAFAAGTEFAHTGTMKSCAIAPSLGNLQCESPAPVRSQVRAHGDNAGA